MIGFQTVTNTAEVSPRRSDGHGRGPRLRVATTLSVCIGVWLGATALAIAAKPVKSATYTGTTNHESPVSFKVSANGKRVTGLHVPLPASCQYGGIAALKPGTARITSKGTFKATLTIRALDGQKSGKVFVAGTFHRKRRESGTITSVFTAFRDCNASYPYSTKG